MGSIRVRVRGVVRGSWDLVSKWILIGFLKGIYMSSTRGGMELSRYGKKSTL